MIHINNKIDCCGCWACVQCCPKQCISMKEDNEGFLYPVVDEAACNECGLCEKVCPIICQNHPIDFEPASFACICNDENLRANSSSGGLSTLFAEEVIHAKGVVFGARFESDWSVIHDYTETIEGLSAFRGSKYVQSLIGDNYSKAKSFLNQGRTVLFSGTPCQIAGLNHFLQKKYDNLITVDFICHSVPSPKIWKLYLEELIHTKCAERKIHLSSLNKMPVITSVSFRDKSQGWKKYGLTIGGMYASKDEKKSIWLSDNHRENTYMRGFLQDLYVRPSCADCPARNYKSGSDITIADCWGIEKYHPDIPIINDNKGVSLALLLTETGKTYFDNIVSKMLVFQIPYNEVEDSGLHSPITRSTPSHKKRNYFYKQLDKNRLSKLIESCLRSEEYKKTIKKTIKKIIRNLCGNRLYQLLKKLK